MTNKAIRQDELIELAKEAGLDCRLLDVYGHTTATPSMLAKFAQLLLQREGGDKLAESVSQVVAADDDPTRFYIPLPGGWEFQTKGKGSTTRLANVKSGERTPLLGTKYEIEALEQMARDINSACYPFNHLAQQPTAPGGEDVLTDEKIAAIFNAWAVADENLGNKALTPELDAIAYALKPETLAAQGLAIINLKGGA